MINTSRPAHVVRVRATDFSVPLGPFGGLFSCPLCGDSFDLHDWVDIEMPAIVVVACDRGQR